MQDVLNELDNQFSGLSNIESELLPPASNEELDAAEQELGVTFPEDFRQLYLWHNGNKGNLFLFGEFRISPLQEVLDLYRAARRSIDEDCYEVTDDSGQFKDCIANRKWIQFADNGGNTIVLLDLDPGTTGTAGQLLAACDGNIEHRFNGIREFMADLAGRIANGELAWNEDSGGYETTDEESIAARQRFEHKLKLIEDSPDLERLRQLNTGDEVTLAGAIKPNHDSGIHKLYIRGGAIKVSGDIGPLQYSFETGPPMVKINVRVGKRSLFGFGGPAYEVISCEAVPQ